jgi:hypothetical protein
MGAQLDLETVAHGHPLAQRELAELYAEIDRLRGAAEDMRERAAALAYNLVRTYKGSGVIARAIRALPIVDEP